VKQYIAKKEFQTVFGLFPVGTLVKNVDPALLPDLVAAGVIGETTVANAKADGEAARSAAGYLTAVEIRKSPSEPQRGVEPLVRRTHGNPRGRIGVPAPVAPGSEASRSGPVNAKAPAKTAAKKTGARR
jgi:hypothetical protein